MNYKQPIRTILMMTESHWNKNTTRDVVRREFDKVIKCRTSLGVMLYASDSELLLVPCTCKSRVCPSCGMRNTDTWQWEQVVTLPEMPFKGITFTMPNFLWPLFQRNRKLLACLPTLGAKVVENWAMENYGVRLMITVVLHTFSRHLTFHPHLHSIVGVFGLRESDSSVVPASFNHEGLMQRWRLAVITLLREALRRGELASDMGREELAVMLTAQGERWWNIHIAHCKSKAELFRYIGRYARRPPIAEQRIIEINDNWVVFWTKDHKLQRKVETWYSPERFVDLLSEHVLDSNQHAVRHYGLLSPRSKNRTQALFFSLLNQHKRPRPKRLSNRESVKTLFNRDPLLDSKAQEMRLLCRLGPEQIAALRLMFPREFSLGRNTPIEIGPGLRRWLEEHASVCTDMNVF